MCPRSVQSCCSGKWENFLMHPLVNFNKLLIVKRELITLICWRCSRRSFINKVRQFNLLLLVFYFEFVLLVPTEKDQEKSWRFFRFTATWIFFFTREYSRNTRANRWSVVVAAERTVAVESWCHQWRFSQTMLIPCVMLVNQHLCFTAVLISVIPLASTNKLIPAI